MCLPAFFALQKHLRFQFAVFFILFFIIQLVIIFFFSNSFIFTYDKIDATRNQTILYRGNLNLINNLNL